MHGLCDTTDDSRRGDACRWSSTNDSLSPKVFLWRRIVSTHARPSGAARFVALIRYCQMNNYRETFQRNQQPKMTEAPLGRNVSDRYLRVFTLAHVPPTNLPGAGFMTCTSTSHQGEFDIFWLDFWGLSVSGLLF